ncbi:MAG: radical SAM protein [Pseudomonadota bacterium]
MSSTLLALNAVTPQRLVEALPGLTLTQARKAVARTHRGEPLQPVAGLSRAAVDRILARTHLPRLELVERASSTLDPFEKFLLRAPDGALIETVRIPLEKPDRLSVCLSSQVGCAFACTFCATGRLGLHRNLETWEMIEQVRAVRETLNRGQRVHGAVFQGMGEPLANLEHVLEAIEVFSDPSALSIQARSVTVNTVGLPRRIRELARRAPKVRLGLSLGSARPEQRLQLMPGTRGHPLPQVMEACVEHAQVTGLAPSLALLLLAGVTDTDEEAAALARLVQDFTRCAGMAPRLSILTYNPIGDDEPYTRVDDVDVARFRDRLRSLGVSSHRRYSGGSDVAAACGQLAGRGPGPRAVRNEPT